MKRMMRHPGAVIPRTVRRGADWAVPRTARPKAPRAASSLLASVAFTLASAAAQSAFACATCGCSLSTDAAMGYSDVAGWRATFEFDFINQDQLRSGTSAISNSQVAAINDAVRKVAARTQEKYSGLMSGLNLPAGMKLPF